MRLLWIIFLMIAQKKIHLNVLDIWCKLDLMYTKVSINTQLLIVLRIPMEFNYLTLNFFSTTAVEETFWAIIPFRSRSFDYIFSVTFIPNKKDGKNWAQELLNSLSTVCWKKATGKTCLMKTSPAIWGKTIFNSPIGNLLLNIFSFIHANILSVAKA